MIKSWNFANLECRFIYRLRLERVFLGIQGDAYFGGRLENYTHDPEGAALLISAQIDRMKTLIDGLNARDPFSLIPALMAGTPALTAIQQPSP